MDDETEYYVIANIIKSLTRICAANSEKVVDLLTGYLWTEKEATGIKRYLP